MFDITQKRATETATVNLKNPDGTVMRDETGKPLSITIYGPGSEAFTAGQTELARKRQERLRDSDGNVAAAVEGGVDDQNAFLADMTVSFNGWEYPHPDKAGKWPGGREQYLACYTDRGLGYIRDQVWAEVHNWSSFTKGSAKS